MALAPALALAPSKGTWYFSSCSGWRLQEPPPGHSLPAQLRVPVPVLQSRLWSCSAIFNSSASLPLTATQTRSIIIAPDGAAPIFRLSQFNSTPALSRVLTDDHSSIDDTPFASRRYSCDPPQSQRPPYRISSICLLRTITTWTPLNPGRSLTLPASKIFSTTTSRPRSAIRASIPRIYQANVR